jgi:5'-3' exonuclease
MEYSEMNGKRVAIDMTQVLYQMFFRNNTDEERTMEDLARFKQTLSNMDVTAWFVFDGNTRHLKEVAHKKRRDIREAGEAKLALMKEEVALVTESLSSIKEPALEPADPASETPSPTSASPPGPELGPGSVPVPAPVPAPTPFSAPSSAPSPVPSSVPAPTSQQMESAWLISIMHTQVDKLQERLRAPSSKLFSSAKDLLEPYVIVAVDDAERHVAVMTARGEVDYAVSADYDTLAFGSPNLVLHFLDMGGGGMAVLKLDQVIKALGLTSYAQFVDFCILCGCDMCGKPRGIGPKRAAALVKKYGSIEAMFDKELKTKVDDTFKFEFARMRFLDRSVPRAPSTE